MNETNRTKRVVVTGAAGFIGSHITEALLMRGVDVVGIDTFTDYYDPQIKLRNIKEATKGKKGFTFIKGDLIDIDLSSVFVGADWLLHFAAQPGVRESFGKEFGRYSRNNIEVTARVLEGAVKSGVGGVVYASSSSVYGEKSAMVREEDECLPISPYGITKMAGEHLCRVYEKNFDLPVVILRFFTVFGPRQRPDMAFSRFIRAILEGGKVEVYGDGEQARDFIFIDDAVRATLSSMKTELKGEIINIGSGRTTTLNRVLSILKEVSGMEFKVVHGERARGDILRTHASIKKAMSLLNYEPRYSIEEGLRLQFDYMKNCL